MTDQHPITPPPELIQQWMGEFFGCTVNGELSDSERYLATQAARWGADQELEACCNLLDGCRVVQVDNSANTAQNRLAGKDRSARLRTIRRPKPPSLAEQALAQTNAILSDPSRVLLTEVRETLELNRRALEQLDD